MKLLQLLSIAVIVTFTSCQKEITWDIPPTGGGGTGGGGTGGGGTVPTGTLLKKIVTKDASDSMVETFTYDASKRLMQYSVKGATAATDDRDERYTVTRDAQGRISQVKEISSEDGVSYDTVISTVTYTAATGTTIRHIIEVTNSTGKDSSVAVYTSGKISKFTTYTFNGAAYDPSEENLYTYDANGNLTLVKSYDISSGSTLIIERKYTYDTKTAALKLGMDEGILLIEYYSGNNNMTKLEIVDHALGLANMTLTFNLAYNTNNMPSTGSMSAILLGIPIPLPITTTHYYQ